MSEHSKTVYERSGREPTGNVTPRRDGRRCRRCAGRAARDLPQPAQATSGIGFVGTAQAQGAAATTPAGAPWWPSRWGADDQAGASNWITPEKVLDAAQADPDRQDLRDGAPL